MSVTCGFFNSLNGDRKYNAEQMSAIFDGIINDGVFASIGTAFAVTAASGNDIDVGVGRAWFNSTWIYNDAVLVLEADDSELLLNRYDAVVIEVDHSDLVRDCTIKIIKGTAASSPTYPTLENSSTVHQYPLAYIYRAAGSSSITQSNITNMIGTSSCPYITGILSVVSIDNLIAQWQAEWDEWFKKETDSDEQDFGSWMAEAQAMFDEWFAELKIILDGDVAANLAAQILELKECCTSLATERTLRQTIEDSDDDTIMDSNGDSIVGSIIFKLL